jgi:hypothetical protein
MKDIKRSIVLSILIILFASCDDNDNGINFYDSEYRKGLWITADKSDTLEFIDNLTLIRKGTYYSREEYAYRIEDKNLVIILNGQTAEITTQHPILITDENSVRLGNMHITNGVGDNSETFYKD